MIVDSIKLFGIILDLKGIVMQIMEEKRFKAYASDPTNELWEIHISREHELYKRNNDIRSPYERDYTRILHCLAYRRLKHNTQVFFNIDNDHICTRMEHVQHVESVSCTIAKYLGLNTDLTRAIAMGHDLGHAPFGHEGEIELTTIRQENDMDKFWHERNSLRVIDKLELLENDKRHYNNLNLTYAVRDGIISHCGEVDENGIKPRCDAIDLNEFNRSGQYQPYTWEGCVVKISDKIAYLGRDIEDAARLNFIGVKELRELGRIARKYGESTINTTVIIHGFIVSICENSSPNNGIMLGDKYNEMLNETKQFNYEKIYQNKRFDRYKKYVSSIIRAIYEVLIEAYAEQDTIINLLKIKRRLPMLISDFLDHLDKYLYPEMLGSKTGKYKRYDNEKIYGYLDSKQIYAQAIIDFISGMTDRYAIEAYNELLKY